MHASADWPVDITRAEKLVATLLPTPSFTFSHLYTTLAQLHLAVTSIDRYGNESAPTQLSTSPVLPSRSPILDRRGRVIDLIHRPLTTAERKQLEAERKKRRKR